MLPPALFRFCSRVFVAVYGRVPLFGELRSSVAVVRRGGEVLLQWRSDGLGWAFPGGTSYFWEREEQTLRREFREETGMEIQNCRLLFVYHDRHYVPSRISVYAAEASGTPRGSWEGEPQWGRLQPLPMPFFSSQQPIVDFLASHP